MFYTKDVDIDDSEIFNTYEEILPPGVFTSLDEGTCSRIITDGEYYIHWFDKINTSDLVCTKSFVGNSIINTSHPLHIINKSNTKSLNIKVVDLNNVIDFYKE